jgi:hypothetical protein
MKNLTALDSSTITTSSTKGLHYRIFVVGDDEIFNKTDSMIPLLQEVNDILSKASNIHLQIVGLELQKIREWGGRPTEIEKDASPFYDKTPYDSFLMLHRNMFLVQGHVESVGCNRGSPAIINMKTPRRNATIAGAVFKMILADHSTKNTNCRCPDQPGSSHLKCLSDNPDNDSMSEEACSCYNDAIDAILSNQDRTSLECLKNEPNASFSKFSLLGNGIIEGSEQCDCFFRDFKCQKTCRSGRKTTTSPVVVINLDDLKITQKSGSRLSSGPYILTFLIFVVIAFHVVGLTFLIKKKKFAKETTSPSVDNPRHDDLRSSMNVPKSAIGF